MKWRSADKYEVVIGLEVHVQLATQSKIFSWSSAAFGAEPNTHDRSGLPRACRGRCRC